jgi:hypothetical protein
MKFGVSLIDGSFSPGHLPWFVPSPEYYSFTIFVPDSSKKSQELYERLAKLCFKHLPAKHIIKLVSTELSSLRPGDTPPPVPPSLPEPLKQFIVELSEFPEFRLEVTKAR